MRHSNMNRNTLENTKHLKLTGVGGKYMLQKDNCVCVLNDLYLIVDVIQTCWRKLENVT